MIIMYGVIICTKCRMHAQIIEIGTSRTTRCQRCGARLEVRKLQLISTSENLDEAVKSRTLMQAKVQANGPIHMVHSQSFQNVPQSSDPVGELNFTAPHKGQKVRNKDLSKIILEHISVRGELGLDELGEKCKLLDIDENELEITIARLLEAGDIYIPMKGKIKKV